MINPSLRPVTLLAASLWPGLFEEHLVLSGALINQGSAGAAAECCAARPYWGHLRTHREQSLQLSKLSGLEVWGDCIGMELGHSGLLRGPAELNPLVLRSGAA